MPYSATSAAATSSWVESGLEATRVTSAPPALQRAHEVGGLGGDVQAGADAQARERPLPLEALADEAQDRHLPLRPLDATNTFIHETEVGDVVGRIGRGLASRGVTGGGLHRVAGARGYRSSIPPEVGNR